MFVHVSRLKTLPIFPEAWQTVRCNSQPDSYEKMSDTTAQPEVFEYQAEMQKLLDILVHSLYTEREIFL